jgi:hypothetical protein
MEAAVTVSRVPAAKIIALSNDAQGGFEVS